MATRSLADALADSEAGPLLARVDHHRRLSRSLAAALTRVAPDFDAEDPQACVVAGNVLILSARSAAQAAKLRQGLPGLLRHLHQQGEQLTQIQVRVQPARKSYPAPEDDPAQGFPSAYPGSGEGAGPADTRRPAPAGLQALAAALSEELPDSPLRRAAQRLRRALGEPR